MKLPRTISTLQQSLIVFALLFAALQPTAGVSARQTASTAACQWTYYPIQAGALQPQQLLFNDPDNTPISNLSTGNLFKGKAVHLATTGSADFDGDNKTDVFRTIPRVNGNLQWQYSSGGTAPWVNLAYATNALPVSLAQFGDFNADFNSDVFANLYNPPTTNYQWLYSPSGTGSFIQVNAVAFPPNRLALGDFNGDGVTDVFTATANSGTYDWAYYAGGAGTALGLAHSAVDPTLLRFGDFNGDGITDVFAGIQQPDGSIQWVYSSGGAASFVNLNLSTIPYSELMFGDFNGDGTTDVLAALTQANGSLQVEYWSGGLGSAIQLGSIPAPAPALRVGDFNGDGISDLMAYRCGMNGPLSFNPLQTLANSGYNTFYRSFSGDLNADGTPDLTFASTCQNLNSAGICASHYLQLGAALGTAQQTFTLVPAQTVGATNLDFTYYKIMTGDFYGDGRSSLALIYPSGTTLTIYVAHSNGNGTFTLSNQQLFGGETWGNFNPTVGDFNGDGKADLAFTTVCAISSGSCSVGSNNALYVAFSTGGGAFSIGARQDVSPSGWDEYYAYAGDFNGDGKTDLVFNSTCQKVNFIDSTCTIGDANYIYTAISGGSGSFTFSARQTYGASGWADYPNSIDLIGDVNGDGRSDLVWSSAYQAVAQTSNNLAIAALANPDGSFALGSIQNLGDGLSGRLSLADINLDGKADLVWNYAPYGDTDVDTYDYATSNGNGSFTNQGQGATFTSLGYFTPPDTDAYGKVPAKLTLVSTRQNSIGGAIFVVTSRALAANGFNGNIFIPLVRK